MQLLVFSTLFPWPAVPHHGIFVRERLKAFLGRFDDAKAVVIAPVPYVPRPLAKGKLQVYRDVPAEENQEGIRVLHPRYPLVPKLSMSGAPLSLRWAGLRALRKLTKEGLQFDLVDAHYLYPDSVAAVYLARKLRCPLVVTARGTDVNLLPNHAIPRSWLRFLLKNSSAAITVCDALRQAMVPLHAADLPVRVLGNGVDLQKFQPHARGEARRVLGWDEQAPVLLSVGHLVERKGHHHVIAALPKLPPEVLLKIVGGGPQEKELRQLCERLGLAKRVEFVGVLPHEKLQWVYSAADVLALLSSREGWPNVLLESMACGTPVVATRVWGSPEVVTNSSVGLLVEQTTPEAVSGAVQELLSTPRDSAQIRAYAEQHSWTKVADGMREVFEQALNSPLPGVQDKQ